ncbi:hypothetical protein [Metabacillus litoralis]|uniref:hypothetical protein n=1 Tax=Metabacillus litoralis TaxID=152268 RepID=UPI002040B24B|nr:hypothetical protein [Metabacillus litoralis]MCM3409181.1 hypothetical protein [Metabacillus litoralis]
MKWRNYGLWTSIASLLYMVFKDLGLQIDLTSWETYVTSVLGILVTLGIISNPENGKGFFNKKTDNSIAPSDMTNPPTTTNNQSQPEETTITFSEEAVPDRKYVPYEK